MGESHFSWEVADMPSRLGRVFDAHSDDREVQAAFGSGHSEGALSREERSAYLFKLLHDGE